MEKEQTNNDNMVNEYINVLIKKFNDLSLEAVTIQTRFNLAVKEKEQLLKMIESKDKDIEDLNAEVIREREKAPQIKEVIKEVEVTKEVPVNTDDALVKQNEMLKKELTQAETKIKKLKNQLQEIRNGGNTEAEEIGDS